MPLARAIGVVIGVALLAACSVVEPTAENEFARLPRDLRIGVAEMVIERVEPEVSRDEVRQAVQRMVAAAPMCLPWPGVWLDASDRRSFFYARYDLMTRDWGSEVAETSRMRMQEFVDLGFLIARPRPDRGPDVVEYELTPEGARYLRGSPYGGDRPSFCAPSERRVVEIVDMQTGQFACGTLRVSFTHTADGWPSWARTENARQRVASAWAPIGDVSPGSVTLARQWFHPRRVPADAPSNGALRSACMDASRQRVTGDDLNMSSP